MKLYISYMATGELYFRHIRGFIETLHFFIPESDSKELYVFTDQTEEFEKVKKEYSGYCIDNNINLHYRFIEHKPWPLNALLKFMYTREITKAILENDPESDDIIFYADSKIKFKDYINFSELVGYDSPEKLITVPHCSYGLPTEYDKLVMYIHNRETKAEIPTHYDYHQSGFFGGKIKVVDDMCRDCHSWVVTDLANRRLPAVDDESYLNKWIYKYVDSRVITLDPVKYWSPCPKDDPYSPYLNAKIQLRDHSDAVQAKELARKGLLK